LPGCSLSGLRPSLTVAVPTILAGVQCRGQSGHCASGLECPRIAKSERLKHASVALLLKATLCRYLVQQDASSSLAGRLGWCRDQTVTTHHLGQFRRIRLSRSADDPGNIGSILEPARDTARHASLPHACSLCGSCADVCPVRIDLPQQLLTWRGEIRARRLLPPGKIRLARLCAWILSNARLYRLTGKLVRLILRYAPRSVSFARSNVWGRQRELPEPPRRSFRELHEERKR
jgi:ferredoxin